MATGTANRSTAVASDRGSFAPWVSLGLACLGLFVIILDATIVSIALPQIDRDLGFGTASLAWVVNAYTLAFAGALLLGGRLVATYGSRVVFLVGLAGFGAASLVCGLSTLSGELVAARAVQGLFGALLMPATLTVVTATYPEGKERARVLGLWSAVGAGGAGAGTVLGGVLTDALGWRWVFLVNVPLAAVGVAGAALVLAVPAQRRRVPLDLIGAGLATGGLVALVYGVLAADGHGWGSPEVAGPLGVALVLLVTFVVHQARWTATPLVPLSIFRSRSLSAANAVIFGLGLGFFASFVLLSVYLQDALGYSPLKAGLAFLPAAAALFVGAQVAGRLTHRYGVRAIATIGGLGAAAGFAWLSQLSADQSYWPGTALPTFLFGLGIGVAFTPITVAATAVEPAMAGIAAGVLNTTLQVSGAVGLAVLTTLADSRLVPGATPTTDPGGPRLRLPPHVPRRLVCIVASCHRGYRPSLRQAGQAEQRCEASRKGMIRWRQCGGSIGLAALVTVANAITQHHAGAGLSSALTDGYDWAFLIAGILIALGAITAAAFLPRRPRVSPPGSYGAGALAGVGD